MSKHSKKAFKEEAAELREQAQKLREEASALLTKAAALEAHARTLLGEPDPHAYRPRPLSPDEIQAFEIEANGGTFNWEGMPRI